MRVTPDCAGRVKAAAGHAKTVRQTRNASERGETRRAEEVNTEQKLSPRETYPDELHSEKDGDKKRAAYSGARRRRESSMAIEGARSTSERIRQDKASCGRTAEAKPHGKLWGAQLKRTRTWQAGGHAAAVCEACGGSDSHTARCVGANHMASCRACSCSEGSHMASRRARSAKATDKK